uniref:Uncharacterized protein n=1 Tax=Arion vulgaris TaxID=1028688 RepID=A0A0B7A9I9_9EUPU
MVTPRKKRKKRGGWFGRLGLRLPLWGVFVWSGIVSVAGLALPIVVGDEAPGTVTTTAHPSGVSCGVNPSRRCLSEASCSQLALCSCPTRTYGDGTFQCYPTSTVRAEVKGIPATLRSFYNTSSTIYWPCRYRFTEITTPRTGYTQQCNFQVFGFNQMLTGRAALTGFEVHLQLKNGNRIITGIGIRKDGLARNNVFTYTERGRQGFTMELPVSDNDIESTQSLADGSGSGNGGFMNDDDGDDFEWGPPEELDIGDGERVACEIDKDNFANVNVPSCGVVIRFRAPSVDASLRDQAPGLSVTVNEGRGPVTFERPGTYIAETSTNDILRRSARQKNLRQELEILHNVMENAATQQSTPQGLQCDDTARVYRTYCDETSKKNEALNYCSFFLEKPDLILCMDPPAGNTGTNSLNAFKLCIWQTCRPSRGLYDLLKSRVNQNRCISLTPSYFSGVYAGT